MNWSIIFQGIESLAVVVASIIATITVFRWRADKRFERRAEVSGTASALAYEAADSIRAVRNVAGYSREGATRSRDDSEGSGLANAPDNTFIPVERLGHHLEVFAKMKAYRYRLMVEFGSDWHTAFDEAFSIRSKLMARAHTAMDIRRDQHAGRQITQPEKDRLNEFDKLRWEESENDPANQSLEKMIRRLDDLCKSIKR